MDRKTNALIQRLIANAKKIQRAKYKEVDELFHYTIADIYPKNIADLAEAFGMMAVKLEAREYALEKKIRDLEETSAQLRASNEKLEEYTLTLEQKVTERTEEISKMAAIDDLTKLLNRKEILRIMRHELSKRNVRDLSLVFFDIDHFKNLNDSFGHQAGDDVLRAVGGIVKKSLRESDVAGRYGGEEFLVILPESGGRQALKVADRIREGFAAMPFVFGGREVSITSSFGVVSLADNAGHIAVSLGVSSIGEIFDFSHGKDKQRSSGLRDLVFDLLLKMCDQALYRAKKTSCLDCGFESDKAEYFRGGRCSHCGGLRLEEGRNRVKTYLNGAYI